MAHTYFFNDVTAVIADARKPRLQALRSNLYYMGFRETVWAETAGSLEQQAEQVKPDIIIAALDLPDGNVAAYFRKIRTGLSHVDPFTPIIAVLSQASTATVRRGVDSGADDVLIYPWPVGYLDQRLQNLIHTRKPFVVTADYVGPDRRAKRRPGPQAPMITPLNVLEAKALKRQNTETVAVAQANARRNLRALRIRALAGLIVGLVGDLDDRYARGDVANAANTETLKRIIRAVEEAHAQLRMSQTSNMTTNVVNAVARHAGCARAHRNPVTSPA